MIEKIEPLTRIPHIIIVGEGPERFHIVHSELVDPVPASHSYQVLTDRTVDGWENGKGPIPDPSGFTWIRGIFGEYSSLDGKPEMYPGLSPTYCGHTPGTTVRRIESHINLDTGAGYPGTGRLTMVEVRTGKIVSWPI